MPTMARATIDEASQVPSFPQAGAIVAGIAIPALRGPVNKAQLVTGGETDFLKKYTPNQRIDVGMDLSLFAAAYYASFGALWVSRAANGATTGGLVLTKTASPQASFAVPIALADPTTYDFGAAAVAWQATYAYTKGAEGLPSVSTGFYYVATTAGTSGSSEPTWPVTIGGTVTDGSVVWTCAGTIASDQVFLYPPDPGAWNKGISVKVQNYTLHPAAVQVAGAFAITVYQNAVAIPGEAWVLSTDPTAKDGYGKSIYAPTRLLSSRFLRALVNPAISTSTLPAEVTSALTISQGSDGAAVTDTEMEAAANAGFSNPVSVPLFMLMDGGWATAVYQIALDQLAQARKDCVGIFSTVNADETNSDYLTALLTYRNTTLNLQSTYSMLFSPHMQIADKYNDGRLIYASPDAYIAACIAKKGAKGTPWLPPAGIDQDFQLPVLGLQVYFTESEGGDMDQLVAAQINPIRYMPGRGTVPWGNYTLSSVAAPQQNINIRLLLIYCEPLLKQFFETFLFKLDNPANEQAIISGVSNFWARIKSLGGILSFLTPVLDDSQVAGGGPLLVNTPISPAYAIGQIMGTVTLLNPGATLSLS